MLLIGSLAEMAQRLEAPTLPCSRCGASLPVDPSSASARCTHCGATTPVPREMQGRARAYLGAIARERRKATMAQRFSRGLQGGGIAKAVGAFVPMVLGLSLLLTVGQMLPSFTRVSGMVRLYSGLGFTVGLGLALLWFFLRVARHGEELARGEDEPASEVPDTVVDGSPEGSVTSVCASCGAPVRFQVGEASARCPFCGATVVATADDQARLVVLAGHRADLEQARASRSMYRRQIGFQKTMARTGSVLRIGLGAGMPAILLLIIGASLFASAPGRAPARGRHGPPPAQATIQLVGLGLMGLGGAIGLLTASGLVVASFVSRPRAIERRLTELAAHTGSRLAPEGTLPVLDWLDAHWAGPVPDEAITLAADHRGRGGLRWSLPLTYQGRPAMLVVTHRPAPRIDVFVSSYHRGAYDLSQALADRLVEEGQALRVTIDVGQGGVVITHQDDSPALLAPAYLDRVLDTAGRIAASRA